MQQLQQQINSYAPLFDRLQEAVGTVIVGQQDMIRKILVGLLSKGHVLLEGLPGLAKTLTVQTLTSCLSLDFKRIQFTPDLLPADLIGTQIYHPKSENFVPKLGPIFANIVLADEINRAPAKVQAALLEAMQERQVTLGETTYKLPAPFLVMATQNPLEQEGTYALPEAQVDRFLLKLLLTYPNRNEERVIMDRMIEGAPASPQPVLNGEYLIAAQQMVRKIYVAPQIKEYILDLVFSTRQPDPRDPHASATNNDVLRYIECGASPRATLALSLAARAHAFLQHRCYVVPDDVKAIAFEVLRHRVLLSYEAEADALQSDDILRRILEQLPVP
jgi:MoxR-like ATPase